MMCDGIGRRAVFRLPHGVAAIVIALYAATSRLHEKVQAQSFPLADVRCIVMGWCTAADRDVRV
jgi:hypothetical protein